jgi:hypothetical protein
MDVLLVAVRQNPRFLAIRQIVEVALKCKLSIIGTSWIGVDCSLKLSFRFSHHVRSCRSVRALANGLGGRTNALSPVQEERHVPSACH